VDGAEPADEERCAAEALRPLWFLGLASAAGALAAAVAVRPGPPAVAWALLGLGLAVVARALTGSSRRSAVLWLAAGLALGGGRGLQERADRLALEAAFGASEHLASRITATIREGWSPSRWGWRTTVTVHSATAGERPLPLTGRCALEVRGDRARLGLPPPGTRVAGLVTPKLGAGRRPLLVASSPRLLQVERPAGGLHAFRQRLVDRLVEAAGTNVGRIRTAELATALALGRKDLLPASRRDRWRESGLAHVLAVSGLHVGLVGGILWLAAVGVGTGPRTSRFLVLLALPAYALLAGASPSALRAALMGAAYLGARLIGRPILPMAAVLLAALALLLSAPDLVTDPGFQLTVVITMALVRWVAPLARWLRGPRWLAGSAAVPIVAQLAAAPLVALHFRSLVPGALLANLAAPPLLAPTLVLSLSATFLAPLSAGAAGLALRLLSACEDGLMLCGAPARAAAAASPVAPAAVVVALAAAGSLALWPGRRARIGAAAWGATIALLAVVQVLRPDPPVSRVTLLPVGDGLSVVTGTRAGAVLVDGGSYRHEAAELLADAGIHRLSTLIASHADSDHIGGLPDVLRRLQVETLVAPAWMVRDPTGAELLRAARLGGTRVIPVARGMALDLAGTRMEVLWPPARGAPREENERSLVARLIQPEGTVLLTSDIGRMTERLLEPQQGLRCQVLLVAHHGSRHSSSPAFLDAAQPEVALVPAGPRNLNHHPHPETLARLRDRGIPQRFPARDGWCGAEVHGGRWRPFP